MKGSAGRAAASTGLTASRLLAVAVSACRTGNENQCYTQKPWKAGRAGRTGVGRYCCAKEPSGTAAEVTGLAASRLLAVAVSASCVSTAPL